MSWKLPKPVRNSPHCEIDCLEREMKEENEKLKKKVDQLEFHIRNMNKAMLEMAKAVDSLQNIQNEKESEEFMKSLKKKNWGFS
jgi:prefoldin subunit 5